MERATSMFGHQVMVVRKIIVIETVAPPACELYR